MGAWKSFCRAHLYPFRNANGKAYLSLLPLAWLIVAFGPILLASSIVTGDMLADLSRVALVPSLLGIPPVLAYTLNYLNLAFTTTTSGDDLPPRWPELDVWEHVRSLFFWIAALTSGAAVGGFPAWLVWKGVPSPGPLDQAVAVVLLVFGAVYAQTALATALVFDDILAMNPWMILRAIRGMGVGAFLPLLYAAIVLALSAVGLASMLHFTQPLISPLIWLAFWTCVLYEALVAMRLLGVECRRRLRILGWFRSRHPASSP